MCPRYALASAVFWLRHCIQSVSVVSLWLYCYRFGVYSHSVAIIATGYPVAIAIPFFIWRGCVVSVWADICYIATLFILGEQHLKLFPAVVIEDRYGCRLQILCGSCSCECHFLIIAASRCLVSYAYQDSLRTMTIATSACF